MSDFQTNFDLLPEDIKELSEELKNNPIDPNSFARADLAKVTHLDIKWRIDFQKKILGGFVTLTGKKVDSQADSIFLDTMDLEIISVNQIIDSNTKKNISSKLYPSVPNFGSKLAIDINHIKSDEFKIQIDYNTKEISRALMWMTSEQTGGKLPFMFSQCQAINARSMLPCQDTPSIKATYSAQVQSPADIQVLMSAKIVKDSELSSDGLHRTHFFNQKIPIQSYLVAIAAGDLVSKRIGSISNVWALPNIIESAAWEFAEIDTILEKAIDLAGPYVWEIYDILVLPPSFPFGGMENPCLTFVTPTLLAGDRSLVDVVAHEISHSWTGNLVTNANFGHFWLNEGFTMFLERKIDGALHKDGEKYRQFSALDGLTDLKNVVEYYGETSPFTKLLIDVRGINPDDVFSSVPYEKGFTFLFYLEQKLGGPSVFEPFLKSYIDYFKYKSIVTDDFKNYLYLYFKNDSIKQHVLDTIDWDQWLHKPGMPPIPNYDTTFFMISKNLATKWLMAPEKIDRKEFSLEEFNALSTIGKKLVLVQIAERLNESSSDINQKLLAMSQIYKMASISNCEVKHKWIMLGLKAHFADIIPEAINFVSTYGRMKYIVPIYRALYQWDKTKQLALDTFNANKPKMMQVAIDAVARDLK